MQDIAAAGISIFAECTGGADKCLARPGRKQANVSVRMEWISFGDLPCREKKILVTSRVSMLLKSVTVLNTVGICNTVVSIKILYYNNIISYHITYIIFIKLYYIISYYIILYYYTSYHISYHILSYHILYFISYRIVSYRMVSYRIVSYIISCILYYIILYYYTSYHIIHTISYHIIYYISCHIV